MTLTRIRLYLPLLFLFMYCGSSSRTEKPSTNEKNYIRVTNWPTLPKGFKLGNPTGLGINKQGNLIVFHRADRKWPLLGNMSKDPIKSETILTIDHITGKIINSWGANLFIMPHGLTVDHDDNIWVSDVGLHQVFKFSPNGKLLLKVGKAGISGNDQMHFNQPTDIAIEKDGSFYVSDGYGNSRIIKFSKKGQYLFEWGKKGKKNGEFNLPHAICIDEQQYIYM